MLPRVLLRLLPWLAFALAPVLAAPVEATFNVRAFGATGDGRTLDSPAINRAIEAAAQAGGGTVVFPAGEYLSYSIRLRSHVGLHLGPGATILAADPPAPGTEGGYDAPEPNASTQCQDFGHSHWHNSLIWGEDLEGVTITGPGRIYGRGLSRGNGRISRPVGTRYPPTGGALPDVLAADGPVEFPPRPDLKPGPFGYPSARDNLPAGVGNKAIALKNCRNVVLRDFTILHGGHFGILATGVDNLTIDNLLIDTNRDGMDIDSCSNVRIANCSVNSPWDDGICLKASYALNRNRPTENVTITNCFVSGYDEGTLLDGTRQRLDAHRGGPIGRIKLGTEASGGFRAITISNCVFECCRGLALEQVDGGEMADITVTNLVMRDLVNAPVFIRLGGRLRGPDVKQPGTARRIIISNVVAHNVAPDHGLFIAGVPGHRVEDVSLSNIHITYRGGGTAEQARRDVPELERGYPEPELFGVLPSWGLFARHVANFTLRDVKFELLQPDARPAARLDDVVGARFVRVELPAGGPTAPWAIVNSAALRVQETTGLADGSLATKP
ncbi:glycoside hydrolase family 28 protein [Opitutus sp. ER46]|uniref:rhamnogalacturonidase n=1 Tax=Opitutus sp. ER46 TaxID=2161864 RepID=UPI000D317F6A|nr:glycoside hydrolase family 28 protein [Opitutus sp. ER46]PTX95821.1 exo-poly-alpha-D-galacturonosidase [Opitutus sp. ER46]